MGADPMMGLSLGSATNHGDASALANPLVKLPPGSQEGGSVVGPVAQDSALREDKSRCVRRGDGAKQQVWSWEAERVGVEDHYPRAGPRHHFPC